MLKKVEILSNGSRIKFDFDQTFAQLPFEFPFVLNNVGLCQNRLNTSSNFCSTFARHSNEFRGKVETLKEQYHGVFAEDLSL